MRSAHWIERVKFCVATALFLAASAGLSFADPEADAIAAIREHEYAKAMAIWGPRAKAGDVLAQQGLGGMYLAGLGVPKDPKMAVFWLSQAAEKGDSTAQYNLGQLYSHQQGFIDLAKAAKYYQQAARRGRSEAQSTLAGFYLSGTGVPKDIEKAYVWISLAASAKPPASMGAENARQLSAVLKARVDFIRRKMTPEQQSDAQELLLRCISRGIANCE